MFAPNKYVITSFKVIHECGANPSELVFHDLYLYFIVAIKLLCYS